MMRIKLFLLIVLFLTSCAAPTTPVPTSTLTFTPEPTATIQPTITPNPTETATPEIVHYEISTFKKFEGLKEPVYVIPEDDPSGTEYLAWLHSQETPFDPEAKPMKLVGNKDQSWIWFDGTPDVVKILSDPKKRPYHYGPIGHWVSKSGEECLLLPFDFLGEDGSHNWVVTSLKIKTPSGKNKFDHSASRIKSDVNNWKSHGPIFIFSADETYLNATNFDGYDWLKYDPVFNSQLNNPNRLDLSRKFIDNIDSSLEQPGLIYDTVIQTN